MTASCSCSASNSPYQHLMMAPPMASFASSDHAFSTSDGILDLLVLFPLGHPNIASDTSFLDCSAPASNTFSLCWMKFTILSMLTSMSLLLKTSMKNVLCTGGSLGL